jgi:hypothetical protein
LIGDGHRDLFGDSLRQHASQKIGVISERLDELVCVALANLCDRVFRNRVSAAVANGISVFIGAKAGFVPRVADKPNFVATDTRDRGE